MNALVGFIAFPISLAVGLAAIVHAEEPADKKTLATRVATVSEHGMPKDIVPKGAAWNFGPGSLWTYEGWQYAAFWDDARQVSVGRRKLPNGPWDVVSLPGYQRTENSNRGKGGLVSRGFGDSHEKVAMGISPDGRIHLAFDHHISSLHYRTSKEPVAKKPDSYQWSPDLFGPVQDHLGGPVIDGVTYPAFTSDDAHFTLYLRANGGSGSADSFFFDYENGLWTINDPKAAKFIDKTWSGGDGTVNAYPHDLVIRNERRHLTWCWRDTPKPETCHDLCYAYSDDRGTTWKNNDGLTVAVRGKSYITADSPGISVWPIPKGMRYVNGGSMEVDVAGRVHVLVRGEDGLPAYFTRDAKTGKWTRRAAEALGTLVRGQHGSLFVVSETGLQIGTAEDFGKLTSLATMSKDLFRDCRMELDLTRNDGWITVIGQKGRTVSVVDFPITGLFH